MTIPVHSPTCWRRPPAPAPCSRWAYGARWCARAAAAWAAVGGPIRSRACGVGGLPGAEPCSRWRASATRCVYWARFLSAVMAGIGAWDLATRVAAQAPRLLAAPARRAATVAALALPFALPWWWDPARMDDYFPASRTPLPELIRAPAEYLRHHTDARAVVAGDPEYARWAAALGARRALLSRGLHSPGDTPARQRLQALLLEGGDPAAARSEAARYGVRYLVVTPAFLARHPPVTLEALEARPDLRLVHFTGERQREFVAILELDGTGRMSLRPATCWGSPLRTSSTTWPASATSWSRWRWPRRWWCCARTRAWPCCSGCSTRRRPSVSGRWRWDVRMA